MNKKIAYAVSLALAGAMLLSYDTPKGWFNAGSSPEKYEMGTDKGAGHSGGNAAIIKSKEKKVKGFGTLMQNALPGKYLGKRVKMTGYIRSEDVDGWAGLWFRVDGEKGGKSLAFDNMYDRNVSGTTPWTKYEIVLDVPAEATLLAYGALLSGTGTIWFDDINFMIVESSTSPTGHSTTTPEQPVNLKFDE